MDEPLSNLDAALRVQTRAEILKLQTRLGRFRPEDIELADERSAAGSAGFDATVEVIQYVGDEQLVYLALRDAEIVAKLSVEKLFEPGSARSFSVPLDKLHLFDAETGVSLGTAA